jgi:hypothetical protein
MSKVGEAASSHGTRIIQGNDVEIEIVYSTSISEGARTDIDKIIKPTLDALQGVVYTDDRQVRSVSATVFDKNIESLMAGRVEHIGRLFYSNEETVVLISVYSDSRLEELGGEASVEKARQQEWNRQFDTASRSKDFRSAS